MPFAILSNFFDSLSRKAIQFKRDSYYQAFREQTEFSLNLPCETIEPAHFRQRVGKYGFGCFLRKQSQRFQHLCRPEEYMSGQCGMTWLRIVVANLNIYARV